VPLGSHSRCPGCRKLTGCRGERKLGAAGVCPWCTLEGVEVVVRHKRRYSTVAEAAQVLGIHVVTVRRLIRDGTLKAAPLRPGHTGKGIRYAISRASLATYLAQLNGEAGEPVSTSQHT
jgi:excisionase family DNA binding protein